MLTKSADKIKDYRQQNTYHNGSDNRKIKSSVSLFKDNITRQFT